MPTNRQGHDAISTYAGYCYGTPVNLIRTRFRSAGVAPVLLTATLAAVTTVALHVSPSAAVVSTGDASGIVRALGGTGFDSAIDVAVALDGSFVVVGSFSERLDLDGAGPISPLVSAGSSDAFVARFSAAGALLWAHRLGGAEYDTATAVALGFDGSAVVAGTFEDTAAPGVSGTGITLTSAGDADTFVARYTAAGAISWAFRAGGPGYDNANGVAVDAAGNAVMVGNFDGAASFDGRGGSAQLTAAGEADAFLARYTSVGTLINTNSAGGAGYDSATDVSLLPDGSAVMVGMFTGRATFGRAGTAITVDSAGSIDAFVARYAANGNPVWAVGEGGAGVDLARSVSVGGEDIYVAGEFSATAEFGSGALAIDLDADALSDGFLAAYTASGGVRWVENISGGGRERATDVAVGADGSVIVGGVFSEPILLGDAPVAGEGMQVTVVSRGGDDAIVARYSSGGMLRWAQSSGGPGNDDVTGVSAVLDGTVLIAGNFRNTAWFSTGGTDVSLTSVGDVDGFVLQYGSAIERYAGVNRVATAVAVSEATFRAGAGVAYLASSTGFADALAAGPIAASEGGPVLLTSPTALSPETAAELTRLRPPVIVIVGGESAVSAAVETAARAYAPQVERVSGRNRYETAAALSRRAFAQSRTVIVVSGTGFADAVSGGAAAFASVASMLLTSGTSLPQETAAEIRRLAPDRAVILGGTAAVSAGVETALRDIVPNVSRISGLDRYSTSAAVAREFFPGSAYRAFVATGANFPDALAATPAAGRNGGPVLLSRPDCVPLVVRTQLDRLAPTEVVLVGGTGALTSAIEQLTRC